MFRAIELASDELPVIGRFYNGRDHSTVCYGTQRIECMRESNPELDVLVTELKRQLGGECGAPSETELAETPCKSTRVFQLSLDELADFVAKRVCAYLEKRLQESGASESVIGKQDKHERLSDTGFP